jgi:hypothetical protein
MRTVCLGEQVDEREASLEEWNERQDIYAHHVDAVCRHGVKSRPSATSRICSTVSPQRPLSRFGNSF